MIQHDVTDGIRTLRLSHGKANAMDLELVEALRHQLAQLRDHPAPIIVTGAGKIFSAGVDLKRIVDGGHDYARRFALQLGELFEDLLYYPHPIVAAINGHAIAGGCLLAAAADHRVLADSGGRLGVPELLVGVAFPAAALELLRLTVSPPHLRRIVFGGQTYAGQEAVSLGLAEELVAPEELLPRAVQRARELSAISPDAFRVTKDQLRGPARQFLETQGRRIDSDMLEIWTAPGTLAKVTAYVERTLGSR